LHYLVNVKLHDLVGVKFWLHYLVDQR